MTLARRAPYRHRDLVRLFNPKSVAVFGASENPKAFGARTVANLANFDGRVLQINPRYQQIGGAPCYPSVAELPEVPDCVVLAVPREAVETSVLECAKAGVGGVVVFASGYAEAGSEEGAADQARLASIARDTGLKILGPNCIGFVNLVTGGMVSFSSADLKMARPTRPGVGIISQSGAVGFALGQADRRGMAVSHVLTFGNGVDVGIADQIAFLAEDPTCGAIACLFEGMPDPRQMLEAGEIARAADKPVVICKLGQGQEAATAALSHTGSLAGSAAGYDALFERAGFIVVKYVERLLETASFFAKAPRRPPSRGVVSLGTSGGALIAATDAGEMNGVPQPQPPADMQDRLRALIPGFGAPRNPCDLTAMAVNDTGMMARAVEAMLIGDTYGAMVLPQTSLSAGILSRRTPTGPVGAKLGKPICLPLIGGWVGGYGTDEAEADPAFSWFYSLDSCYAALAAWHRRDDRRIAFERDGARRQVRVSSPDSKGRAAALIKASGNATLTEREAKEVLVCYGLPVVGEKLVQSRADAVAAARALGMPVVLKVESPDLPHKTEAGVIRLGLKTEDEVGAAFDAVMANAARVNMATRKGGTPLADPPHRGAPSVPSFTKPRINGVLVQPMVAQGTEIMVGGKIDPLFGPLVVAGLGGVFVELLKDTALDLAPVTQREALAMLDRLKGGALLDGFRGSEPVDRLALADVIVRFAEFLDDQQELIAECDINPLICSAGRIVAVDALIARR
jgi:acyl-CoA synthetase (NDP forming)